VINSRNIIIRCFAILAGVLLVQVTLAKNPEPRKVYITRKGSKYHRSDCRYLGKSKIEISFEEAKKYYQACKVCKPDSLVNVK
jgi:hypothetical protein